MPKYTSEQQIIAFWNKVNKDGSVPAHRPELGQCWEWTAHLNEFGYGTKTWDEKTTGAHRVSWIIANGKIPDSLWVLHKCDNRKCVRPDHLFLGTRKDNIDDMKEKGRSKFHKVGERQIDKITRKEVNDIRLQYSSGNITQTQLGIKYGINSFIVWFIINFNDW